jgi:hypothetical protein
MVVSTSSFRRRWQSCRTLSGTQRPSSASGSSARRMASRRISTSMMRCSRAAALFLPLGRRIADSISPRSSRRASAMSCRAWITIWAGVMPVVASICLSCPASGKSPSAIVSALKPCSGGALKISRRMFSHRPVVDDERFRDAMRTCASSRLVTRGRPWKMSVRFWLRCRKPARSSQEMAVLTRVSRRSRFFSVGSKSSSFLSSSSLVMTISPAALRLARRRARRIRWISRCLTSESAPRPNWKSASTGS